MNNQPSLIFFRHATSRGNLNRTKPAKPTCTLLYLPNPPVRCCTCPTHQYTVVPAKLTCTLLYLSNPPVHYCTCPTHLYAVVPAQLTCTLLYLSNSPVLCCTCPTDLYIVVPVQPTCTLLYLPNSPVHCCTCSTLEVQKVIFHKYSTAISVQQLIPQTFRNEISAQKRRKHCALALVRRSEKNSPRRRPPSRRRITQDGQNLISWRRSLPSLYRPSFGAHASMLSMSLLEMIYERTEANCVIDAQC